ncbi:MAG: hypothetical protein QXN36_01880 [Candidatus Bathyarchaeia archaeon]
MQKSWTDRNVNLELLVDQIGEFFKEKDFNAVKGTTDKGYQIFADDSKYYKIDGYVSVSIEGKPEKFSITFELCKEEHKRKLPASIMLVTMFGGGYFLRKQLKSDEEWLKLKRDFWIYVDKTVSNLTNTMQDR